MAFSNCSASLRVPYQLNGYSTSVTFFNQKLLNIKFTNEHKLPRGYKNRPKIAFVTKKVTFLKYVETQSYQGIKKFLKIHKIQKSNRS